MAATEHETRLGIANTRLLEDIHELKAFVRSLADPERYGHAVTKEVRSEARRILTRIDGPRRP